MQTIINSQPVKANDNTKDNIHFPILPSYMIDNPRYYLEREIYVRFMRHMRQIPSSTMTVKVLSAIQFTADMMELGEEYVSKALVDMGLRAPRQALPLRFLLFADKSFLRKLWDLGCPNESLKSLKAYWDHENVQYSPILQG